MNKTGASLIHYARPTVLDCPQPKNLVESRQNPNVVHPARTFTVVRRASVDLPDVARAHPMHQALVEAARRVAGVLSGASLSATDLQGLMPIEFRRDVHDLVFGTLRRYAKGDAMLRQLVDREPDNDVRALLLVSLYRLDRRPDSEHVVVDQAVDAAGAMTNRKAGGFVNAVLRNFLRKRAVLAQQATELPEVIHQHPAWGVQRVQAAWPDHWREVMDVSNEPPPVSLRVNVRRTSRTQYLTRLLDAGISASALDGFEAAIRLPDGVRVDALPGFSDGDFAVQDPGAQLAAEWLDLADGQGVLDACAAPGGKSGHLLELAKIDLLALDVDANRCRRIEDNLKRLGHQARIVVGDAGKPELWWDGQPYDRILADVPCTASGVVRRHPDVKWLRREDDIRKFARAQMSLLRALWPLLAPGGKVLYATCSVFPEENHLQISAFNAAFPEASLVRQTQLLPNARHDGFFYALLEKPLA